MDALESIDQKADEFWQQWSLLFPPQEYQSKYALESSGNVYFDSNVNNNQSFKITTTTPLKAIPPSTVLIPPEEDSSISPYFIDSVTRKYETIITNDHRSLENGLTENKSITSSRSSTTSPYFIDSIEKKSTPSLVDIINVSKQNSLEDELTKLKGRNETENESLPRVVRKITSNNELIHQNSNEQSEAPNVVGEVVTEMNTIIPEETTIYTPISLDEEMYDLFDDKESHIQEKDVSQKLDIETTTNFSEEIRVTTVQDVATNGTRNHQTTLEDIYEDDGIVLEDLYEEEEEKDIISQQDYVVVSQNKQVLEKIIKDSVIEEVLSSIHLVISKLVDDQKVIKDFTVSINDDLNHLLFNQEFQAQMIRKICIKFAPKDLDILIDKSQCIVSTFPPTLTSHPPSSDENLKRYPQPLSKQKFLRNQWGFVETINNTTTTGTTT